MPDFDIPALSPLSDIGPADRNMEGAYRRGYHQAVAEVANLMEFKQLSAQDLLDWVEGPGMAWRKDTGMERMIVPPEIG